MSAKFISGEKSSRSSNVASGISGEAEEISLSGSAAALSAVASTVFSAADEAVEADDSDEAAVSEDVVVILAVVPFSDEMEELVDEAEEVKADVSAVVFACFSFTEQPAEISVHSAKIKENLRFMVCVPFPILILITNKTIDKKSSYNLYLQDYTRFFVQFLIGAEYKTSLYIKLENHEKSCSFW